MKRALAVVAVIALSSCDAVESTSTAATAAGSDVTVDQLEHTISALGNAQQGLIDVATDTIAGDNARVYLSALIQSRVTDQFLAQHSEQITDADREAALAQVTVPPGLPDDVVRLIGDSRATPTVVQRVPGPDAEEAAQRYGESPAELGLVCVRQVVLPTEDAADDVVDALAEGATMADMVERSIDQPSKANGGEVRDSNGSPCLVALDAATVLGSEVVVALGDAGPGEIVGPVRGAAGWHVLQVRPFDEVADAANGLLQQAGGQLLFIGYLTNADVTVDPRYGRWDPATGSVVAL